MDPIPHQNNPGLHVDQLLYGKEGQSEAFVDVAITCPAAPTLLVGIKFRRGRAARLEFQHQGSVLQAQPGGGGNSTRLLRRSTQIQSKFTSLRHLVLRWKPLLIGSVLAIHQHTAFSSSTNLGDSSWYTRQKARNTRTEFYCRLHPHRTGQRTRGTNENRSCRPQERLGQFSEEVVTNRRIMAERPAQLQYGLQVRNSKRLPNQWDEAWLLVCSTPADYEVHVHTHVSSLRAHGRRLPHGGILRRPQRCSFDS